MAFARAEQACLLLLGVGRACASVGVLYFLGVITPGVSRFTCPAQNFKVLDKRKMRVRSHRQPKLANMGTSRKYRSGSSGDKKRSREESFAEESLGVDDVRLRSWETVQPIVSTLENLWEGCVRVVTPVLAWLRGRRSPDADEQLTRRLARAGGVAVAECAHRVPVGDACCSELKHARDVTVGERVRTAMSVVPGARVAAATVAGLGGALDTGTTSSSSPSSSTGAPSSSTAITGGPSSPCHRPPRKQGERRLHSKPSPRPRSLGRAGREGRANGRDGRGEGERGGVPAPRISPR